METFMDENFLAAEAAYLSADVRNLYDPGERYDDVPEYWRRVMMAQGGGAADGQESDCQTD